MAPVEFKLSKAFESTRRISFIETPSWSTLASKIAFLYDIPAERVGVSYVDSDGDEITLSSNEELQDYLAHANTIVPGATLKLTVHDMGIRIKSLPPTPRTSRNTFGMPVGGGGDDNNGLFAFVDPADDEWHSIPTLAGLDGVFGLNIGDEGPHAFVEVIPSESSALGVPGEDDKASTSASSDLGQIITPTIWKGKERAVGEVPEPSVLESNYRTAVEPPPSVFGAFKDKQPARAESVASGTSSPAPIKAASIRSTPTTNVDINTAASVLASETPTKPPIHVQPVRAPSVAKAVSEHARSSSIHSESILSKESANEGVSKAAPEPAPSATLYNDIATLITTAAAIFSQHPELNEGLRNLISHATSGAYLGDSRETLARGMEEVQRAAQEAQREAQRAGAEMQKEAQRVAADAQQAATEAVRAASELGSAAEHEARSRVAEALGGLFSAFAAAPPSVPPSVPQSGTPAPNIDAQAASSTAETPDVNAPRVGISSATRHLSMLSYPHRQNRFTWHVTPSGVPNDAAPTSALIPSTPPIAPFPLAPPVAPMMPIPPVAPTANMGAISPLSHFTPILPPVSIPPVVPVLPTSSTLSTLPAPPLAPLISRPAPPPVSPAISRSQSRRVASDPRPSTQSSKTELTAKERLEQSKRDYQEAKEAYRRDRAERIRRGENISSDSYHQAGSDGEKPVRATVIPIKIASPPRTPAAGPSGLPNSALTASTSRRPRNVTPTINAKKEETIVSQARNGSPALEIVSVPSPSRRMGQRLEHRQSGASLAAQVVPNAESSTPAQRIRRRLADMGFSETIYDGIPDLVEMQLAQNKTPSKSEEDEMVTKLLEEMLSYSPPKSQASLP